MEATIELLAVVLLFRKTHQSWWLVALILVPDVLMLGYAGGTKLGATCYSLGHSQIVPILLCLAALDGTTRSYWLWACYGSPTSAWTEHWPTG